MTTNDELLKLIALGDKATARPWRVVHELNVRFGESRGVAGCGGYTDITDYENVRNENVANAAYITAAANLAPDIARELIEARALLEQLRKAIDGVRDVGWYSPVTPEYKTAWKKVDAALKGGDL